MTNETPSFDPYGAKQAVLQSHVGTLYDKNQDLLAMIIEQRGEIEGLRSLLLQTLDVIAILQRPQA